MTHPVPPATGIDSLPPLRAVLAQHGIVTRKSLGQHFLFDLNLTRRIVAAAGDLDGVNVVEVGAGPGGLTRALLESPANHVWAVERDTRCIAALQEVAAVAGGRLTLVEADALTLDLARIVPAPRRIVANLPYNVGTPLLLGWLAAATDFVGMTLMFQKEVADRLTASPRSKNYGRLSILTQWLCETQHLFDVNPSAFVPPPAVVSTVVELIPRTTPLVPADRKALETVTRHAFGQRRKMLRQSLKPLGGEALLERAGIVPTARAEELSVAEFCALANAFVSPDAAR
jgi:16S rRNA (adenine1518-N6/adenine1519-N6)-dimethyltransferase